VSGDEFDPGGFEHAPNRLKIVPSSDASADFKIEDHGSGNNGSGGERSLIHIDKGASGSALSG
jgi:hypothetical protein